MLRSWQNPVASAKRAYLSFLLRAFFDKRIYRYEPTPFGRRILRFMPSVNIAWSNGVVITPPLDNFLWVKCSARGYHEPFLERVLAAVVESGAVIVDAGAQVGLVAVMCAKLAGTAGRVYAFEPQPENYRVLNVAVARNNTWNVEALNIGLAATTTQCSFWPALLSGWSQLPERRDQWPPEAHDTAVDVKCMALDDFVTQRPVERIDVLKVDVDGADFDVLRGATRVLDSEELALVIFECSCYWAALGNDCQAAMAFLQSRGFDLYLAPISGSVPYKVESGERLPKGWGSKRRKAINVFGVKNSATKRKLAPLLSGALPLEKLAE